MTFDYDLQKAFMASIHIEDIGNTALCCRTCIGKEYYMILRTIMGKTAIFKFGPLIPDLGRLPSDGFNMSYQVVNYKESIIAKDITSYINNPKNEIIQIEEIPLEEALEQLPSPELYLASIS